MIYIDPADFKKSPNGRKSYAHMVGTTMEELDSFAASIGVKKHFFHRHRTMPHYDVTAEQRELAIAAGAIQVTSAEITVLAKAMCNSLPEVT